MSTEIYTYGGGEILESVFNAIAMLVNHKTGSLFRPLMVIGSSVGAFWAIVKVFFSPSAEALISKFFIPFVAVIALLMLPTTTVHIYDLLAYEAKGSSGKGLDGSLISDISSSLGTKPIAHKYYKVDNVPFILGQFAKVVSSIGYHVTTAVETVMHTSSDKAYLETGMIFGSEVAIDGSQYKITNANLDQNLRKFCKQCVLYDIALDRYSIDDMKKSSNLLEFFDKNTSKTRMILYCPVTSDEGKTCNYKTCKESIGAIKKHFTKETEYYSQNEIMKNLPLTFQALTGLRQSKEDFVSQQLVMNLLKDEYNRDGFAKERARVQQKSTYQVIGSLAGTSLVTMRAIFEALIYASFIFVVPLSVLPGGISFIFKWAGMVIWIQLWPPFYAILSYVIQVVARSQSGSIFYGLSGSEVGYSLFTSAGINDLHDNISVMAGYLSMSIPYISYALVSGGVSSFIHMAGSLMSPAHSAGSAVASESMSGNYNFANAQMGQMSYQNTSFQQKNMAPMLSHGFMTENRGTSNTIYGEETQFNQGSSNFRTTLSSDRTLSYMEQGIESMTESVSQNEMKQYVESASVSARNGADFTEFLGSNENLANSTSENFGYNAGDSARYVQSAAKELSESLSISEREALQLMYGARFDTQKGIIGTFCKVTLGMAGEAGINSSHASSTDDVMSKLSKAMESEELQTHLSRVEAASKNFAHNSTDEMGQKISSSWNQSMDEARSSQESYQAAYGRVEQATEQFSRLENDSAGSREILNQKFYDFMLDKHKYPSRVAEIFNKPENDGLLKSNVKEFMSSNAFIRDLDQKESLRDKYDSHQIKKIDKDAEKAVINAKFDGSDLQNNRNTIHLEAAGLEERFQSQNLNYQRSEDEFEKGIKNTHSLLAAKVNTRQENPRAFRITNHYVHLPGKLGEDTFKGPNVNGLRNIHKPFYMD
jgi:conjugal transfer mating pair stabilization protein TraG